jgi:hypothetical protein
MTSVTGQTLARAVRIGRGTTNQPNHPMLETIAIVLVVLWLLGLVSSYTMGGFIHLLLVIALITILIRAIRGNKPLA